MSNRVPVLKLLLMFLNSSILDVLRGMWTSGGIAAFHFEEEKTTICMGAGRERVYMYVHILCKKSLLFSGHMQRGLAAGPGGTCSWCSSCLPSLTEAADISQLVGGSEQ